MVELTSRCYGADLSGDTIRLAGHTTTAGRTVVDCLEEYPSEQFGQAALGDDSRLYFSVVESEAIIKKVRIPGGTEHDSEKLALFEFGVSNPGDTERYFLETHRLGRDDNRLVVAFHRHSINQQLNFFERQAFRPSGFKLRAWALASGYRHYCWKEGGELICLVAFDGPAVSYCFLKDLAPVHLGCLENKSAVGSESKRTTPCLTDLAATINYQLAGMFRDGCTAPLSLIVVSGRDASPEVTAELENIIGVRCCLPTPKTALFSPEVAFRAGKFLVSLGLTVDL